MIKGIKRILILSVIFAIIPSSSYAQDIVNLSVDQAIERAIDLNTSIDSLELKLPTLDDAIRKSKFGAESAALMLHKYKAYVDMYNTDNFTKYNDMTSSELNDAYGNLFVKQISVASPTVIGTSFYSNLLEEIEYIEYIYMFGSQKPELTDEKIYKDYKKTEVFATVTAEFEKKKLLTSIDSIKNVISTNISTLYKSALDYKFNIDIQRSLIIYKKSNLDVLKKNYDLGLVSKLDYEKEKVAYEKNLLEYENLVLGYTNFEAQLKNQLKIPYVDTLILVDDFSERFNIDSNSINEYKTKSKESNIALSNLKIELDIKKRKLELFNKYIDNKYDKEYVDLNFEIDQLDKNIKDEEKRIEVNVDKAWADLVSKDVEIKNVRNAFYIAKIVYADSLNKSKLGLMSSSQLSGVILDMQTKGLNVKIKERELDNSKYLFDKLINYGVKY